MELSRISFTINGKQCYLPGTYSEEMRSIIMDWATYNAERISPLICTVEQHYHNKLISFSFKDFCFWYKIRQQKTVFVPDIWYSGDLGWVEVHGHYGQTMTFGDVTVQVSEVKEGHGVFKATPIPPGSYDGFTVIMTKVSSDESFKFDASSVANLKDL